MCKNVSVENVFIRNTFVSNFLAWPHRIACSFEYIISVSDIFRNFFLLVPFFVSLLFLAFTTLFLLRCLYGWLFFVSFWVDIWLLPERMCFIVWMCVCVYFVPCLCRVLCVLHKWWHSLRLHTQKFARSKCLIWVRLWWITAVNLTFLANLQRPIRVVLLLFPINKCPKWKLLAHRFINLSWSVHSCFMFVLLTKTLCIHVE